MKVRYLKLKIKIKKIYNFVRTSFGHTILEIGIILSYLPILHSNDIDLVKGFAGIALLFFLIYTLLPINTHEIAWNKYKKYIKNEVKKDDSLKHFETEMKKLEGEI